MTAKKAKKKVGKVDIDFSSLHEKPQKSVAKKTTWNPWPRCHPNCEVCMDDGADYQSDVNELRELTEETHESLLRMADLRKSIESYAVRMRKHVKSKSHKGNIANGEC
jgi:hypothetical protein